MPTVPADVRYEQCRKAFGRNPLRMWKGEVVKIPARSGRRSEVIRVPSHEGFCGCFLPRRSAERACVRKRIHPAKEAQP